MAAVFAGAVALGIVFTTIRVWLATLLIGALHSFVPAVPAVGWEAALVVVVLFSVLSPTNVRLNRE